MTTLLTLQKRATWWWLVCGNYNCMRARPVALAPFIIRWGLDTPRERLEQAAKCERCGHKGGRLEHPSRGSMPGKGEMGFKAEEYRRKAEECEAKANDASDPEGS